MQRCLKNKPGQTPGLALIVAVMDGLTHHHTSVISTSSIFSAGLRWFCVGGGGAARTWEWNKTWMVSQLPDSVPGATSHLPKHVCIPGVSEMLSACAFHLIITVSHTEKELLFRVKCEVHKSGFWPHWNSQRHKSHCGPKSLSKAKAWGWKQEKAMLGDLKHVWEGDKS